MKNKSILLLTALATVATLASCNSQGTSSSIPSIPSSTPSSSSEAPKTKIEKFQADLEGNNVSLTTDDNWCTTLFFNSNAFIYDFSDAAESEYGKVDVGYLGTEQGIFKYTLDSNKKVVLGRCESVTTVATVSDFMTFPYDLVDDLSLWEEKSTDVFTTHNATLTQRVAEIGGDGDYYYYITDILLDLSQNVPTLSYTLNGSVFKMSFESIGTTTASYIEEFYANPTVVDYPSDYPADMKADMNKILNKELPFYEMSYAYEYDSEMQTLADYGCGNQTKEMDSMLLKDGFTWDKERSRKVPDSLGREGFIDNLYYKRIVENGSIVALQYIEVGYSSGYYMDDYYGTDGEWEAMYPEGRFSITFVSYDFYNEARFNAYLEGLFNQYGGFGTYVPLHLSEETYLQGTNYKDYAEKLGVEEYLTFSTVYSDDSKAKADLKKYIEDLTEAEYETYSGSTLGVDDIALFKNSEDYSVNITISYKEGTGKYSLTVFIGEPVTTGEVITWNQFKTKIGSVCIDYPALPTIPEDLEELEEVSFVDITEIQKGMKEHITANEVYIASYFGFEYEDAEQAKKNAKTLSASFVKAGYSVNSEETFEEDGIMAYTFDAGEYVVESTVVFEDNFVIYAFVVYNPIRS